MDLVNSNVYGPTRSTVGLVKSTERTSETKKSMRETSELFDPKIYQKRNYSLGDFLAKLSRLLAKGKALKIQEALCSMRLQGLLELTDIKLYSLRTSKDYSATKKGAPLKLSSESWMSWGMTANGKCLTARISEFHRTGNECSLSDILEDQVENKYFLSQKAIIGILRRYEDGNLLEEEIKACRDALIPEE